MRMLKRTAVAVVTAGSLSFLGAGFAHADTMSGGSGSVELNLTQQQACSYEALIPVNVALGNLGSSVGSFACSQQGAIGGGGK